MAARGSAIAPLQTAFFVCLGYPWLHGHHDRRIATHSPRMAASGLGIDLPRPLEYHSGLRFGLLLPRGGQ